MKKRPTITLGLVQRRCTKDVTRNLQRTLADVEEAARAGAQIICTQELFRSQYFCQTEQEKYFQLAESIPGPSTRAFQRLAQRHQVVIIASLFERRAPGLHHNTAVVIDADGKLMGRYRKMHIPDDPLYYEKYYFTPGDLGYQAFQTRYARVGVLICWDQWYPEAARLTAMQGAEILFYPTAIGWHPVERAAVGARQHAAWETAQRAHAVANGCFVAAVNRTGKERPDGGDGIEFWGQSFVADTSGEVLARASLSREQTLMVPVNLGEIESTRIQWPFWRDRRIDSYAGLTDRYGE